MTSERLDAIEALTNARYELMSYFVDMPASDAKQIDAIDAIVTEALR